MKRLKGQSATAWPPENAEPVLRYPVINPVKDWPGKMTHDVKIPPWIPEQT